MIGQTISHYKITAKLGEGGMGEVYLATDTNLDRPVAIKFLSADRSGDPEARQRFIHEAKAQAMLSHSNIATFHDVGEEGGRAFLVMEYVEGPPLPSLARDEKLSLPEILDLVIQVGEGLQAAHEHGVIHRDIKPENILVTSKRHVKITDFGLARWKGATTLTKDGTRMGTAYYMSPEQAAGKRIDHRSDIFSLGVILYELVCHQRPFEGENEPSVLYEVLNTQPHPLARFCRDAPEELQRIVSKCLAKRPEERYQSAADLIADLTAIRQTLTSAPSRTRGESVRTTPSIAVLPFADLSADRDQEYFCDGIAEEIINAISQVEGLRVAARTSCFAFKGKEGDIREIGSKLNVGAVLEGSVRKSGKRLRITVQLVNVEDGYHLWSERYDRDLEDVFAVQDDIAATVVEKLTVRLLGEKRPLMERHHTENVKAYEAYLRGRHYWNQRDEENLRRAIREFERALEIDPHYALAYAGLADSYSLLVQAWALAPHDAFPKAKAAALRAIELDSSLAEPYASLGCTKLTYEWDWQGAERDFKHALTLNPNYATAHQWYAVFLSTLRRDDEAIREARRALDLDPLSPIIHVALIGVMLRAGRLDDAERVAEEFRRTSPDNPLLGVLSGRIRKKRGELDRAAREYAIGERAFFGADNYPERIVSAAEQEGWQGYCRAHLAWLHERVARGYVSAMSFAIDYAELGDAESAITWLEKAVQAHDMGLLQGIRGESSFEILRTDERYREIVRRLGFNPT